LLASTVETREQPRILTLHTEVGHRRVAISLHVALSGKGAHIHVGSDIRIASGRVEPKTTSPKRCGLQVRIVHHLRLGHSSALLLLIILLLII